MSLRLASVSIDLDEVPRYTAIHGLHAPTGPAAHAVYDRCVPRLLSWLEDESIRATFFTVGEDLQRAENRKTVVALHDAGHEVANHSYQHHYDLTRRSADELRREVEGGAAIIEEVCGKRPVGFRAPGYTVSDALYDVLESSGVQYDSSVFPCPSYYAAKLAALAAMKLRGRQSTSIVGSAAVLRAPREPYRVGRPYWRRGSGLLELPIGVTPWQLPYIGTSLVLGGRRIAAELTRQMIGRDMINLELHGFDMADAARDGLGALTRYRADLKRTVDAKLDALRTALRVIREAGYEIVTLEEAAIRINAERRPNP
jgi:peptidoglycan/xylan/chitin deacetylase (PgdA/CDA1 family)